MTEDSLYRELLETERRVAPSGAVEPAPVTDYAGLVRAEAWPQAWDPGARKMGGVRRVAGGIWSDAIERCLQENGSAFIPRMDEPVYIDRPIVLHGGNRLVVHPETRIRLKPGARGTCMVRNAGIVFSQDRPVAMGAGADRGIIVEGGIWSDQSNENRGRGGAYDEADSMPGAHGIFLLHNIAGVTVRNVRFLDCSSFAIQLGNASGFVIEDIVLDETMDGIHIEGPSAHGIIRRISGKTNDDLVALNAWDWDNSSLTFGPITDVLVEDVEAPPGYTWSELRLLPGTKVFPGGATVACDIRRCVYRNIRGIHTIKMYDQPNIEKPLEDFASPIGRFSDIFFADIAVAGIRQADYYDPSADGVFDICADVESLSIRNVRFDYTPGTPGMAAPYLVSVGPKSWSLCRGQPGQEEWFDVFNPDASPVVETLRIRDVFQPDPAVRGKFVPCAGIAGLVHERRLSPNPDFPRTMPRGGTGRGRVVGLRAE